MTGVTSRSSVGPSAAPLAPGREPAPGYEVIAHLSRGRRLDVYDAWSHERSSRCILKLLRPERSREAIAREKLLREGRLLQRFAHPHIVRAYETIIAPDPIVVMETLGGETLGHLIERQAPLAPEEIGQLGLQLASAISFMHHHGYLHLDLKPDNVVAEAERAKVIDLSLARPPGRAPAGIGTWCYLAPEQARGGELGPAADVWGIGAVLFEAASAMPAFDDPEDESGSWSTGDTGSSERPHSIPSWDTGDEDDLLRGDYPQLERTAPPLSSVSAQPTALCGLIDACLAPDPAARPTVTVLMARLEPIAGVPRAERRHAQRSCARP